MHLLHGSIEPKALVFFLQLHKYHDKHRAKGHVMAIAATGKEAGLERPGRLPELLKRLHRALIYNRTLTELETMPSACLRDLGIGRKDIRRFAAEAAFGATREG